MKNNNKITNGLTILFFIVSILDIIGVASNSLWIQLLCKPLIISSLMALYYYSVKERNNWYLLALFFSLLGDIFLLDKNGYFLLGIGSFLITQIIFIKIITGQLKQSNISQRIRSFLPFALYFIVLILVLKENLNEFLLPVIIYGITISIFGMVSLLNYLIYKTKKSMVLLIGATLFIVSDSMIALNKFHEPKIMYPVAIMITYILAQYLIYQFMAETDSSKIKKK